MEMTPNNANVFACSVKNLNKVLANYGKGNVMELSLLKLIYRYACYTECYECLQRLDAMISHLQFNSKLICIDKIQTGDFYPDRVDLFVYEADQNHPPTMNDVTVNIPTPDISPTIDVDELTLAVPVYVDLYTFTAANFMDNFMDLDGDGPGEIILTSIPASTSIDGRLMYDGVLAVENQVIDDPTLLVYQKINNSAFTDSIQFRRFDDRLDNPALSAPVTITLTTAAVGNSPATIGDNSLYRANRAVTVLTTAMFTSLLTPPYNDPDGDLIDAIRIDEISTSNQGQFLLSGVPITVGQIISKASLDAGDFTHVGPNQEAINTDSINWSARDVGTLTFVS